MPDDKRALDYLRQFGYLPDEVALDSPQGPAAVRACQAMALLPATGAVDAETEKVFERPRCGFPDRQGALEAGIGTFVAFGTVWDHAIITYRINNLSPDLTPSGNAA